MLLSIIIPVYKVEEYVEKCLQSVVDSGQNSLGKYEVIVVDDGSPDQSGLIADGYAQRYPFFRVVHKENAGVAAARNTGMDTATGKWLYFVDSDDWLVDGAVDKICQRIEENKESDILMFDAYQNVLEKEQIWEHFSNEKVWSCKEDIWGLQRGMLYFPLVREAIKTPLAAPWDKVYRRAYLQKNGISFQEQLKVLDDMVFNFEAFGKALMVAYYKDRIYHYRFVPDSITNQYKANRVELDCMVWEHLQEYINEACQQGLWSKQEKETFLQAYYARIVKSFSICTRLQFFHKKNPEKYWSKMVLVKQVMNSQPYKEAFQKVKLSNMEWKLKVMAFVGRMKWGLGVHLLYLGQRWIGK